MKKNQWTGKAAGVLMGTLVAVLVCGMPGADKAFAKTQTPQEAAEKVTQAWGRLRQSEEDEDGSGDAGIFEAKSLENIISIYGGSERRYIRQRISVRRMGQYGD